MIKKEGLPMNDLNDKRESASIVIIAASIAAAATSGTYTAIINKIPGAVAIIKVGLSGVEVMLLTKATKWMCGQVAEKYGYREISGMSKFIGVLVGTATGIVLANKIIEIVSGVGEAANAVATATLHLVTGIGIAAVCELIHEGIIDEKYIKNVKTEQVSKILGVAVDLLARSVRECFAGNDWRKCFDNGLQAMKRQFASMVQITD